MKFKASFLIFSLIAFWSCKKTEVSDPTRDSSLSLSVEIHSRTAILTGKASNFIFPAPCEVLTYGFYVSAADADLITSGYGLDYEKRYETGSVNGNSLNGEFTDTISLPSTAHLLEAKFFASNGRLSVMSDPIQFKSKNYIESKFNLVENDALPAVTTVNIMFENGNIHTLKGGFNIETGQAFDNSALVNNIKSAILTRDELSSSSEFHGMYLEFCGVTDDGKGIMTSNRSTSGGGDVTQDGVPYQTDDVVMIIDFSTNTVSFSSSITSTGQDNIRNISGLSFVLGDNFYCTTESPDVNDYEFVKYNLTTDTWTVLPTVALPYEGINLRGDCSGFNTTFNGKAYFFSGRLFEFDPVSEVWTEIGSMGDILPQGRENCFLKTEDSLYLFYPGTGGRIINVDHTNGNYYQLPYNASTQNYSVVPWAKPSTVTGGGYWPKTKSILYNGKSYVIFPSNEAVSSTGSGTEQKQFVLHEFDPQ